MPKQNPVFSCVRSVAAAWYKPALIAFLPLVSTLFVLAAEHQHIKEQASGSARSQARLIAQDLNRTLSTLNLSLERAVQARQLTDFPTFSDFQKQNALFDHSVGAPHIAFFDILDADGNVAWNSDPSAHSQGNFAKQDYFTAHKQEPALGLYIGKPFANIPPEKALVSVSRRISLADGGFAGVAVAGLRLAMISQMSSQADLGHHGTLSVFRNDGLLLLRTPGPGIPGERTVGADSLFRHYLTNRSPVQSGTDDGDNGPGVMAFEPIPGTSLTVGVKLLEADFFAVWWTHVTYCLGAAILASGFFFWFGQQAMGWRQAARTAQHTIDEERAEHARRTTEVAHELRTPLTALLASSLDDGPERSGLRECIQHMQLVLSRYLDSKSPYRKLDLRPVDVDGLVQECLRICGSQAASRGLALKKDIAPDVPRFITTDGTLLREVIFNLVTNGIKFTKAGFVSISLRKNGNLLDIEVIDTGKGVPPGKQQRLFVDADRLDQTDEVPGTGHGLAIVQRAAVLLEGRAGYRPGPAGGSIFWVQVPLRTASLPPHPAPASVPRNMRVLVADDSAAICDVLQSQLVALDNQVVKAANGADAAEYAKNEDFDVVIMDLRMPITNGVDAARQIRALPGARGRVPIVAMSADRSLIPADGELFDAFEEKPFVWEHMLATLASATRGHPPVNAVVPPADKPATSASVLPVFDHSVFQQLTDALPPDAMRGHLRHIQRQMNLAIAVLAPGKTEDSASDRELLHELRGAAGTLGFARVSHSLGAFSSARWLDPPLLAGAREDARQELLEALVAVAAELDAFGPDPDDDDP